MTRTCVLTKNDNVRRRRRRRRVRRRRRRRRCVRRRRRRRRRQRSLCPPWGGHWSQRGHSRSQWVTVIHCTVMHCMCMPGLMRPAQRREGAIPIFVIIATKLGKKKELVCTLGRGFQMGYLSHVGRKGQFLPPPFLIGNSN